MYLCRGLPLKKAATYSPALRCSTIGVPGLNFSVRDGKRWNPGAKATRICLHDTCGYRRNFSFQGKKRRRKSREEPRHTSACTPSGKCPHGAKANGLLVVLG